MEKHRTITFREHQIHYRDEGRQYPQTIVFLHGFLQNQDVWCSYVLSFMRSVHVISIDLPGHGLSDCYGDVYTMEFMADAVKAVLDDARVEQCVLVGHSMGGYVALAFAEKYPYLLRGMGLVNSHGFADTPEAISRREDSIEQIRSNRAGYIIDFISNLFDASKRHNMGQELKDLQDDCLETSIQGAVAAQRGMACRPSRLKTLSSIEVPILFVIGKEDPRIPVEEALSQTIEAKHAEILLLSNVGHMAHLEEREYVKLRLLNFVNTCYF